MSSNINPSLEPTKSLVNFRFWCQKVLPLVYDDSLSYYEVLGKMVVQLNDVIDDVNTDIENVDTLKEAFLALQTYVNEFFDDIDQLASYAERAEAAQTAANTSAINAATSASNASQSSLAAMNARDAAVTARQAAETSANTASTAATNANTKASEAAQSAITAQTAQASASQSATLAATDRSAAQTAASTATTKAGEASTSATNAEASASRAAQSAEDAEQIIGATLQTPDFGEKFSVVSGKYVIIGNVCILTARIKCVTPTRWFGSLPHALASVPIYLFDTSAPPLTVNGFMSAYNGEITLTSTEGNKLVADHEYIISLAYIIEQ